MLLKQDCPFCGKDSSIEVDEISYRQWRDGAMIQDAFPTLSANAREQIITGSHGECFDKAFKDDDESE